MTLTCTVCQASTDAALCKRCTAEIERALAELPADLADLQAVATRQAAGPLGLGHGHYCERVDPREAWQPSDAPTDEPWVFAAGAADQLWAVGNTLSTWIRHLCESRGIESPRASRGTWTTRRRLRITRNRAHWWVERVFIPSTDQPLSVLIDWLLSNLDAVRCDVAAAQIHDELTSLPIENRRWIMLPPPEEEFHGLCDSPDVRADLIDGAITPRVSTCGTRLWSREKAQRIDCPTCGATYTRAERQASMLAELVDTLGTVRQVAATLTTLGRPVTVNQINHWVKRGQIAARGTVPRMVRIGDVLDQRAATTARRLSKPRRMSA